MSDSTNPCFSKDYATRQNCLAQCTLETCPLSASFWGYLPSLAANGIFLALFSISFIAFVIQAFLSKKWVGFTIAMLSGGFLEILGYAGRIWAHSAPFNEVHISPMHIATAILTVVESLSY